MTKNDAMRSAMRTYREFGEMVLIYRRGNSWMPVRESVSTPALDKWRVVDQYPKK